MIFFESWNSLGRTALTGVLAYIALVFFLRISGKRTLSKMNAFDLVVTVALGSTLASVLLSRQAPLADGLLALALLIVLQYVIAWLAVRVPWFQRLIKSQPVLLFHRGAFLDQALRQERVVRDEIYAAVRSSGIQDMAEVRAVVLETDGTFTVLRSGPEPPDQSSLATVERAAKEQHFGSHGD